MRLVAIILAVAMLSSCTTVDPRLCPRIASYTRSEQQQMATELRKAGPGLRRAMRDYLKLRDQARACRTL